ncbi:MAG: NAD(+)/NADH kinase [Mariprofundaceae bacterium]|nr:NAD(+)/NADH kinase [Mariprofundaceae bacterium]
MKRIGITIKPDDDRAQALAAELCDWLKQRGCTVFIDAHNIRGDCSGQSLSLEKMPTEVELMIVLGGDGTLLTVGRKFIGHDTPILGINLGRLGFLTDTPVGSMFDVVEAVFAGNTKVRRHFGLKAESWRGSELLNSGFAMNDVVLQRNEHPRMIEFEMSVGGQFVFRLRGDGLVLATPAGSTAYALSAGGPIVHPDVNAICVAPICPHILSNRPIIVPADDGIELTLVESPKMAALNLDGQEHMELQAGDRVTISKGGEITLVYLPDRHYYETLRSKLYWAGHEG